MLELCSDYLLPSNLAARRTRNPYPKIPGYAGTWFCNAADCFDSSAVVCYCMTGLCLIWTRVHWQHDSHEPVDTGWPRMPNLAQADGLPPCSTHGNACSGHSITCMGCAHASLCALNFLALHMWHSTRSAQEHSGNLTLQNCQIVRRCGMCARGALCAQFSAPTCVVQHSH